MVRRCITIVVVHPNWLPRFEWAAGLMLNLTEMQFIRTPGFDVATSLLKQPPRKGLTDVDVLGNFRRQIIVVPSMSAVPEQVRLAATHILHAGMPLPHHVRAARRLAGLPRLPDPVVQDLVKLDPDLFEAFVARPNLHVEDLHQAARSQAGATEGPKLSDLPGFKPARKWADALKRDVADWKEGKISWAEVEPRAVLHGPPGTGKTLFASALAAELGIPLVATSVAQWQSSGDGYLGNMLRAMRASFSEVMTHGCAILFIEELDGIGRRGQSTGKNSYYESNVVNCFLEMTDEVTKAGGTIIVGATNRLDDIDPAILRSGRLERHIKIELPDPLERAQILRHHLSPDVELSDVSKVTERLYAATPSDLQLLARKARRTARQDSRAVTVDDVRRHLPERAKLPEAILRRVAIHECGHGLVALASKLADDIVLEIQDDYLVEGMAVQDGGFTSYRMIEAILSTEATLLARIRICLGGMAAEEVIYGNRSIGGAGHPASDLAEATKVATQLVMSFGLGKSLTFMKEWRSIDAASGPPPEIQQEVHAILAKELRAAKELLAKDKAALIREAAELVVDRRREYRRA